MGGNISNYPVGEASRERSEASAVQVQRLNTEAKNAFI